MSTTPGLDYDVIIIGAGMSGLYQLHRLRALGLKAHIFEAGSGVGGTWYWNRYPGARFDSESYSYGYSFSEEVLREWNWSEHFASQPETERYINHVADTFDLKRDITFHARVRAAQFDDAAQAWTITLESGAASRARFLVTAIGPLSAPTMPPVSGGPGLPHRALAEAAGRFHRQARRRHRHRLLGGADHPGGRENRGASHRVPAHPQLVRAAAQRRYRLRDAARNQGQLPRDVRPLPGDLRLLPPHAGPAGHLRGDGGGARGVLTPRAASASGRAISATSSPTPRPMPKSPPSSPAKSASG
ncbi:MAG: NAD(P)-binding protein [Alphaproteobacteria bacterium]|nr:NAD(P)-binding protein [Alphaproteobacteria bacterium]